MTPGTAPSFLFTRRDVQLLLVMAVACVAPGPLSAAEPISPPGDCTEEQHRTLKQEVGRACKATSMKCYEHQDCATLIANWLKFQRCIDARLDIMNNRVGASDCSNIMIQNKCPQTCW